MERNARFELTVHSFLPTMETGSGHETHLCIPLRPVMSMVLRDIPKLSDEATSSVDPENEDELQRAIEALTHDKTIIMIAHRLKTVRNADQIIVLDNAHIVQRGTHAELIQQKGLYADFVSARQEAIGWKLAQ